MKNNKFIIPNVNLTKFYRICAFRDASPKSINLKEKTFRRYLKLRNYLFGGQIKAESYSIFIDELRKSILSKIISKEELVQFVNKPLNPTTIKTFFEEKEQEISNSSIKALLSLLIKVYLLDQINVIKNINVDNEIEQDKEIIYYYLLRRRNFISVKELKNKFRNYPRKHKINDYLIELWIEEKIDIIGLDIPKKICKNHDFKNLPLEQIKDFKSVERFRVRETGELRARIMLQDNYKLYPLNKGD